MICTNCGATPCRCEYAPSSAMRAILDEAASVDGIREQYRKVDREQHEKGGHEGYVHLGCPLCLVPISSAMDAGAWPDEGRLGPLTAADVDKYARILARKENEPLVLYMAEHIPAEEMALLLRRMREIEADECDELPWSTT